jgi:hypothetical protein
MLQQVRGTAEVPRSTALQTSAKALSEDATTLALVGEASVQTVLAETLVEAAILATSARLASNAASMAAVAPLRIAAPLPKAGKHPSAASQAKSQRLYRLSCWYPVSRTSSPMLEGVFDQTEIEQSMAGVMSQGRNSIEGRERKVQCLYSDLKVVFPVPLVFHACEPLVHSRSVHLFRSLHSLLGDCQRLFCLGVGSLLYFIRSRL